MGVTRLFCTPLGVFGGWSHKDYMVVLEHTGILEGPFSPQLSILLLHVEETLLHSFKGSLTIGILGCGVVSFGAKAAPRGGGSGDG